MRRLAALVLFTLLWQTTVVGAQGAQGAQGYQLANSDQAASDQAPTAAALEQPEYAQSLCPELTDSIYRLYTAYFGRVPDEGGFDFWNSNFSSGERNLGLISDFFAAGAEFDSLYGSLGDEAIVSLVYQNVMDRVADADGLQFWVGKLTNRDLTRGQVMTSFSESEEYVKQTNTHVPAAGYFSWYPVGTTWTCSNSTEAVSRTNGPYVDLLMTNSADSQQLFLIQLVDVSTGEKREHRLLSLRRGQVRLLNLPDTDTDTGPGPGTDSLRLWGFDKVAWALVQYPTSIESPDQRGGWGQGGAPLHYPTRSS